MDPLDEFPRRHVFGPFEVDTVAGELFKGGSRVRLPPQPFAILNILLKNAGEVVTREQFRDQIWSEGMFVNFEQGLNTSMNKLRTALGDPAEKPRYIETVPGRGYRFIGILTPRPAPPVSEARISEHRGEIPSKRSLPRWWWLVPAAACLVAILMARRLNPNSAAQPPWRFHQLTADTGLSNTPALSNSGDLVAYSSDSGPNGERDLYLKHVAGGRPIRLTFDGAGNTTPDFSPDGSRIVFRSNRDGGGIYEMPALGGDSRLLVRSGMDPKFSPDGSQIAYWIGTESVALASAGSGAIMVVPAVGGAPRRIAGSLTTGRHPIWSPDGKHLLFTGYSSMKSFEAANVDWWVAATNREDAKKTGVYQVLVNADLQARTGSRTPVPTMPKPGCWSAKDNSIVFSVASGDAQNLWEIGLSPQGEATGLPRRLTAGSGNDVDPSCRSGGASVFASVETKRELWSIPFDFDRLAPQGALERITKGADRGENPSLSKNGTYLASVSHRSGQFNIWRRNLTTGNETIVASSPFVQRFPISSPSGSEIAFSVYEKDRRFLYLSAPGGVPEKLCEGCLRATDWSRDGKSLLVYRGNPYEIDSLEIASHRQTPLLKRADGNLLYGRFSPDDRWISFTARIPPASGRVMIAPIGGPKSVPESSWIAIAEIAADDYAIWSPDGRALYFTSDRDGHTCLWAQRIDANYHPVGDPVAVQHIHGPLFFGHGGWSLASGRIVVSLVEQTGNVWIMSRSDMH